MFFLSFFENQYTFVACEILIAMTTNNIIFWDITQSLLHIWFSLGPDDGSTMFLQNVELLPDYTALHKKCSTVYTLKNSLILY
jgi:hypothetical protein